jgi:hypothetical protein
MMTVKSFNIRAMDSFLLPADLCDDRHTRIINCCGSVRQNHKETLGNCDNETLKLKQGDIHAKVKDVMTAVIWKDKQDVCIYQQQKATSVLIARELITCHC